MATASARASSSSRLRSPQENASSTANASNGVVRVADVPAKAAGRASLVECELERAEKSRLKALVADLSTKRSTSAISQCTFASADALPTSTTQR
jgi:hypothetical protein